VPLGVVRLLFLMLLVGLLVWVLRLPNSETAPEGSSKPFENLKIWAALALGIQILIYSIL